MEIMLNPMRGKNEGLHACIVEGREDTCDHGMALWLVHKVAEGKEKSDDIKLIQK